MELTLSPPPPNRCFHGTWCSGWLSTRKTLPLPHSTMLQTNSLTGKKGRNAPSIYVCVFYHNVKYDLLCYPIEVRWGQHWHQAQITCLSTVTKHNPTYPNALIAWCLGTEITLTCHWNRYFAILCHKHKDTQKQQREVTSRPLIHSITKCWSCHAKSTQITTNLHDNCRDIRYHECKHPY